MKAKLETVIVRGNLTVTASNDIFTAPETDRELLVAVLKIAAKVVQPTKVAFVDLQEHLTPKSSAAEIALALKFVGKPVKVEPAAVSA